MVYNHMVPQNDYHKYPLINVRFDEEDRALLQAVCDHEKLTRSDIIRRAVRQYAQRLGVKPPKRRRAKR